MIWYFSLTHLKNIFKNLIFTDNLSADKRTCAGISQFAYPRNFIFNTQDWNSNVISPSAIWTVLRGNQQRENKQNYLSIIAHDLKQKRKHSQTIKLFGCFYYRLLVMRRPNWIYCVIDRLPDRLPMCHRSKNCSCHRRFMALSMHVAMVMYLQCYHAHQSTPCWRRIDQDLPSGILSVIIWLQRQTVCDTWGWGVGGAHSRKMDPFVSITSWRRLVRAVMLHSQMLLHYH